MKQHPLARYGYLLDHIDPVKCVGTVKKVQGLLIECHGPQVGVGEVCRIALSSGEEVLGEVVGVREERVQLMPYQDGLQMAVGDRVVATGKPLSVPVSRGLLGRVLDPLGIPLDGKGYIKASSYRSVYAGAPKAMERAPITERLITNVRVIDGLIPLGKGQRIGIFSGSGVGKSTLLGMIARHTRAQVNVIALIGERGREVREFLERILGQEGLSHSVVVVSPSDAPALMRVRGAYTATTIAEYFRDQGEDVILFFDSVTRFALSQREIGLAIGEPPATRGYTPSVFALLPRLLERSGVGKRGSITGLYTILVEGNDLDEPVSDAVRGILDGHIVLSEKLAKRHHYPPVDVLRSISRLLPYVTTEKEQESIAILKRWMALYEEKEDLISIGAYAKGSDPALDEAIEKREAIRAFLVQGREEKGALEATLVRQSQISGIALEEKEGSDA